MLGITVSAKKGGAAVDWSAIGRIALRAVLVWLVFTLIGVVFARHISNFLKRFKSVTAFSVLSLGMAFVISGIFEKAGLALIVGAYVMGLSLSRTDLSFVIRDKLHTLELLLVPLFFTVMGMMVDPRIFASKEVLVFGLVYTAGSIIAKILGCGLPALGLGFNFRGALRIGLGMVPRGEVALIIAGIGISYGVLDSTEFGVAIMMTLLTTVAAPPLLNMVLKSDKRGTTRDFTVVEHVSTVYSFPSPYLTGLIENRVVEYLKDEGFFVSMFHLETHVYRVAKDDIMFTMNVSPFVIDFQSEQGDVAFLKNVVFESLISLHTAIENLAPREVTGDMKKELVSAGRVNKQEIRKWLNPDCIIMELAGNDSHQVIEELVDVLYESGEIDNKSESLSAVLERERSMSTGLADGLAIPHAKVEHLHGIKIAVGFSKKGVDFSALDGRPCTMVVLILSPSDEASSHLLLMSNITSLYAEEESRERIYRYYTSEGVYDFLTR